MPKRKSTTSLKAPKSRKSTQVEHSIQFGSSQIPATSKSGPDVNVTRLTNDFNVEELTATITKSVTDAVLFNLRQSGILSPPSTSGLQSKQTTMGGPTSSNINSSQEHMTLSTASCDRWLYFPQNTSSCPCFTQKKGKIWAGEYIDLSSLQEEDAEDICLNLRTGAMSSTGKLKKGFMNIEQWTDAFNIFAAVRRLRFPAEAEGLAAYMNLIGRIAHDKGSWYFYDTTFRKLKQTTDRAWDVIDNELFILALSWKQQPFPPGRESDSTPRPASRRIRSCHKFNYLII